jgi:hypothetical protein
MRARFFPDLFQNLGFEFNLESVLLHQLDGLHQDFRGVRDKSLIDAFGMLAYLGSSKHSLICWLLEILFNQHVHFIFAVFNQVDVCVRLVLWFLRLISGPLGSLNCLEEGKDS